MHELWASVHTWIMMFFASAQRSCEHETHKCRFITSIREYPLCWKFRLAYFSLRIYATSNFMWIISFVKIFGMNSEGITCAKHVKAFFTVGSIKVNVAFDLKTIRIPYTNKILPFLVRCKIFCQDYFQKWIIKTNVLIPDIKSNTLILWQKTSLKRLVDERYVSWDKFSMLSLQEMPRNRFCAKKATARRLSLHSLL